MPDDQTKKEQSGSLDSVVSDFMDDRPNIAIWKSYVWHGEKCYFVSTIERTYDTYAGSIRGQETLVWEYKWDKAERGNLIHQAGSVVDHERICRCIIAEGIMPDEDDPRTARFFANAGTELPPPDSDGGSHRKESK